MSQTQSSPALWSLGRGEALSLDIGPGARQLSVTSGRVWLTQSGNLQDVWLESGDSLALPGGAQVVMEAWPEAQFQLLVPPAACRQASSRPASAARAPASRPAPANGLAAA